MEGAEDSLTTLNNLTHWLLLLFNSKEINCTNPHATISCLYPISKPSPNYHQNKLRYRIYATASTFHTRSNEDQTNFLPYRETSRLLVVSCRGRSWPSSEVRVDTIRSQTDPACKKETTSPSYWHWEKKRPSALHAIAIHRCTVCLVSSVVCLNIHAI